MTEATGTHTWSTARLRLSAVRAQAGVHARLLGLLGLGLVLRLVLSPFGEFKNDVEIMRHWAERLTSEPLTQFYAATTVVDHLPGDLWLLWLVAHIEHLFVPDMSGGGFIFLLKLVPALADVGSGVMLYLIARRLAGERIGLLAAAFYLFNPAPIFLGAIWGQWDSVSAFVALTALWLLLRGQAAWALPVLTYAVLIKPPFAALVPIVILVFIRQSVLPHTRWARVVPAEAGAVPEPRAAMVRRAGLSVLASLIVLLVVTLPFDVGLPLMPTRWSLWDRVDYALNYYPWTTLLAFNFWALRDIPSVTNFHLDNQPGMLGLTPHAWGIVCFAVLYAAILIRLWREWDERAIIWASFAIMFATFMVPTRVHERYLLPAIVFGALIAALGRDLRWTYVAISLTFFLELYWVYGLYYHIPKIPLVHGNGFVVVMTVINVAVFIYIVTLALPVLQGRITGTPRSAARGLLDFFRARALAEPPERPFLLATAEATGSTHAVAVPMTKEQGRRAHAGGHAHGHQKRTIAAAAPAVAAPPAEAEVAPAKRIRGWAITRLDVFLIAGLCVAALVLYVIRLDAAKSYVYDEVYHAYTAAQYVKGNADAYVWYTTAPQQGVAYEWTHPPLGKLIMAGGIWIAGDDPFGWRIAAAVFGAIGIGVVYVLGWQVAGRRSVGFIAAGLLLFEGLYFVQARTGMVDIFLIVFTTAALIACYRYLTAPVDQARRPLLWTGLFMGMAAATKWNGFYACVFIGLVALWRLYRLFEESGRKKPRPEVRRGFQHQIIWIPIALIALPAAIYLCSYIPFFLTGHSFSQFWELQHQMFYYHTHLKATHKYASSWWSWPFDIRPVWYFVKYYPDGQVGNIYALGNPILFWAFLPAVALVSWRWWHGRRAAMVVLWIGFFGQWLPWVLSPRVAFIYHFLPAVPFGILAIAVVLDDIWRWASRPVRYAGGVYVAAAIFVFAYLYPILTAVPLTHERFNLRMWLHSWR